ncbi:hypothetical protein Syun_011907 [Stephania yunnanensis]|uniref:Enolase N-terminal domain-containing protein n=1 Tax=Stephania yunnanensis TaxID=152371 RepID=A0AAP0PFX2_9MAGN
MSSLSRVVTALLVGDWKVSLRDLVLFEEIWKLGFGFGGFWRWCSEFELLSAGAHAFYCHQLISPRRRLLCLSLSVPPRRRLLCPFSSSALSVAVVSSLDYSHCFRDAADQTAIDNYMVQQLDGTLGANVILAVSLAFCKAGASMKKVPLYKFLLRTSIEAKLQRRRQELTQTTPDQPVDDEAVYYKVAGECHKGRVYGFGSLGRKKRRYVDADASTSQVLAQRGMDNFMILSNGNTFSLLTKSMTTILETE